MNKKLKKKIKKQVKQFPKHITVCSAVAKVISAFYQIILLQFGC